MQRMLYVRCAPHHIRTLCGGMCLRMCVCVAYYENVWTIAKIYIYFRYEQMAKSKRRHVHLYIATCKRRRSQRLFARYSVPKCLQFFAVDCCWCYCRCRCLVPYLDQTLCCTQPKRSHLLMHTPMTSNNILNVFHLTLKKKKRQKEREADRLLD